MIESDRFVSAATSIGAVGDHGLSPKREDKQDRAIRPDTLADYRGQPAVRAVPLVRAKKPLIIR